MNNYDNALHHDYINHHVCRVSTVATTVNTLVNKRIILICTAASVLLLIYSLHSAITDRAAGRIPDHSLFVILATVHTSTST